MDFAERLKQLRKKSGKTQIEVADLLGIGRITYQNYERGLSIPNGETILKLSKLFNVSSDFLLGNADLDSNACLMALAGKNLDELTDDQKAAVKQVIDTFLRQNQKK